MCVCVQEMGVTGLTSFLSEHLQPRPVNARSESSRLPVPSRGIVIDGYAIMRKSYPPVLDWARVGDWKGGMSEESEKKSKWERERWGNFQGESE